ncbi:MAG: GntR family transcriptional regulator [Burkholderiaceae bacterium]
MNSSVMNGNATASAFADSLGNSPRYRALAQQIKADISAGRYPVGGRLPTEEQLMASFGVSRHTVRQALRELKDNGTILSMRGIGTVVRDKPSEARYTCGINSLEDLLQFVDATEMRVLSTQTIIAEGALCHSLRCAPGRTWFKASIARVVRNTYTPLSYLEAYVPPEYAGVLTGVTLLNQSVYSRIEQFYGVRIVEVHQQIAASRLSDTIADAIQADPNEPALCISRYYLDAFGDIVQVSIGHFPGDRYKQESKFRMKHD